MAKSTVEFSPRHLVLIGMMGSGKSAVGRLLSGMLELDLVDNDARLAASSGMTTTDYAKLGLGRLHELERKLFQTALDSQDPSVVTAPGSIAEWGDKDMLSGCVVAWLSGAFSVLFSRSHEEGGARPESLIETKEGYEALSDVRAARYEALSDFTCDVTDATPGEVAERIAAAWKMRLGMPHGDPDAMR